MDHYFLSLLVLITVFSSGYSFPLNDKKNVTKIPFIVGGTPTRLNEVPYQVAFRMKNSASGLAYCGGTIINENWILSAAHCFLDEDHKPYVTPDMVEIVIGGHDLRTAKGPFVVHPEKFFTHEKYYNPREPFYISNDIALIKVKESLFVKRVSGVSRAASLPNQGQDFTGMTAITSGYGRTDGIIEGEFVSSPVAKKVHMQVMGDMYCKQFERMDSSSICASKNGFEKGTCHGDSGGPLVVQVERKNVLIGITSYGLPCDSLQYREHPEYFTRVSNFIDWINIM